MAKKKKKVRKAVPTIEFPGVSYPGQHNVDEITKEVLRQAKAAEDLIVSANCMMFVLDKKQGIMLSFGDQCLPMSRRAIQQICAWMGLATNSRLFKRLRWGDEAGVKRDGDRTRFWDTWCNLVNDHFDRIDTFKLLRIMEAKDGHKYIRAFLSDRYMIIPNDQLLIAVVDKVKELGVEIWDAALSEDSFYIYAVAPGIQAQIRKDRPWGEYSFVGDGEDAVNAALRISNSETGQGGCSVCPAIITQLTHAYFVKQNALAVRHLGARHKMDELLSPATLKKRNAVVYDEIRDYCASVFDEVKFQSFVDRLQDATQDEIDVVKASDALQVVYDISESRKNDVLNFLMKTGDRSRYGLANAVGAVAKTDTSIHPDEAASLEHVSADLINKQTAVKLAKAAERAAAEKVNKRIEDQQEAISVQQLAAGRASEEEF
jgi:hypothetical protein